MILQYFRFGDNGVDGEDISDVIVGQPYITSAQFIPNTIPFNSAGYLVSNDCNFLITFSTNIFGLSLDKFNTINCTLSNLSGSSGQSTYNFIVTPSSRPGTFSISLDANKVTDSNGIGNIASEIYSKYAPVAPTCTITDNVSGNVNVGGSVTFTFTWSESVTGFDSADISVTGGAKGTFSGSGSSYSLSVTQSGSSGDITVSFGASVCTSTNTGMSNASGASYSQGVMSYHKLGFCGWIYTGWTNVWLLSDLNLTDCVVGTRLGDCPSHGGIGVYCVHMYNYKLDKSGHCSSFTGGHPWLTAADLIITCND